MTVHCYPEVGFYVWLSNKARLDSYDDLNAPDKSMVWTLRSVYSTYRVTTVD